MAVEWCDRSSFLVPQSLARSRLMTMNDIVHSRPRRWGQGSRRGRSEGGSPAVVAGCCGWVSIAWRRRRLLTTMPPVAEFPLRQFGGSPEGIAIDSNGNSWVLLAPGSIAELSSTGGVLQEYEVPSYNALGTNPGRQRVEPRHLQQEGRQRLVLRVERQQPGEAQSHHRGDHRVSAASLRLRSGDLPDHRGARRQHLFHRAVAQRGRDVRHQQRPNQPVPDAAGGHPAAGDHRRRRRQYLVHRRRPEQDHQPESRQPRDQQLPVRAAVAHHQ